MVPLSGMGDGDFDWCGGDRCEPSHLGKRITTTTTVSLIVGPLELG